MGLNAAAEPMNARAATFMVNISGDEKNSNGPTWVLDVNKFFRLLRHGLKKRTCE